MAKINYSKLNLNPKEDKVIIIDGLEIEVKQYLPIEQKLEMISDVINQSIDGETRFFNVGKLELFLGLEIFYNYTNINFTNKQKENFCKLYDTLVSSGLYEEVKNAMDENEYFLLKEILYTTIENIYKYNNSVYGIMDNISKDYANLDLDASSIQKKLSDPESLKLLKDVMAKLG